MVNLFDAANNHKENKVKNIAELESVDVTEELHERTYGEGEKAFTNTVIIRDIGMDEETHYRVPKTVIGSLKVILKDNPTLKAFKVLKSGSTKTDTVYTVVPLV